MQQTGLFWHVHHDALAEWCTSYDGRVARIKATKPAGEIETRLRLFKPVRNPPIALVEAGEAYVKAWEALVKAREALVKAREAIIPKLKALHKVECPNCPWDGKTIFPSA